MGAGFRLGYTAVWAACIVLFIWDVKIPASLEDVLRAIPRPELHQLSAVCAYTLLVALLSQLLPGRVVQGTRLKDGTYLDYKINGLLVTLVVSLALAAGVAAGRINGAYAADNFFGLWVVTNLFSLALSSYLFVVGRYLRVSDGKRRSALADFVLGSELNPHVMGVNVKFFSYRPAMGGWLLVNLSFLYKQYEAGSGITLRMMVYQVLANFYCLDYFYFEENMITTWDIIAEKFGFMLVWADYFFIPLTFSLQNVLLVNETADISVWSAAAIVLVFAIGYIIFRGTNLQKHQYKLDPSMPIWGRPPVAVGGKLLASGFWGLARHINYFGDLVMALAFCLPCAGVSGRGFFYFFYLLLLLLHRDRRDEIRCAEKYQGIWDAYCAIVPSRIVPGVY